MTLGIPNIVKRIPHYAGLRMTADEFLELDGDGFRYELVNGVVGVSPSPALRHQRIAMEISRQLAPFLHDHAVGEIVPDVDVKFAEDLVYRPDLLFLAQDNPAMDEDPIRHLPDVVIEIISPSTRRYDYETKRGDYERFGVREYWIVDPEESSMTFLRLVDGKYVVVEPEGDAFRSAVIDGFALDLTALRKAMAPPSRAQ